MAKTQKYSDDLLLTAVVKYAEVCKTKIKATELAQWARQNIPELAEVRDYMFTRPVKVPDSHGTMIMSQRPCTVRINEINQERSAVAAIKTNLLLKSSNVDEFFTVPRQVQRNLILDTREQVEQLISRNTYLEREWKRVNEKNQELNKGIEELDKKLHKLNSTVKTIEAQMKMLVKVTNEEQRKDAMARIGVTEDKIDIAKHIDSMAIEAKDAFSILKTIQRIDTGTQAEDFENDDDQKKTKKNTVKPDNRILDLMKRGIIRGLD